MVDATGVKVLLETEADHTGSNPVLTTEFTKFTTKIKIMKEIVIDYIYPLCAIMITIGIWAIAIELEKIRKK